MFVRKEFITALLCTASVNVASSDSDVLFDQLLQTHPFEFSACEAELQSADSACTEPDGLEKVTLTGEVKNQITKTPTVMSKLQRHPQ